MKTYKIASIPADGIGPEVIAAGLQALEALARRDGGFTFDVTEFDWSSDRYKKTGALMPEDGPEQLARLPWPRQCRCRPPDRWGHRERPYW